MKIVFSFERSINEKCFGFTVDLSKFVNFLFYFLDLLKLIYYPHEPSKWIKSGMFCEKVEKNKISK